MVDVQQHSRARQADGLEPTQPEILLQHAQVLVSRHGGVLEQSRLGQETWFVQQSRWSGVVHGSMRPRQPHPK
eukprot:1474658-Prymnesium_polylepis.1